MVRYSIILACAFTFFSCAPSDLSTDEGVMKFYCWETGMVYEEAKDWICVERFADHDNVIVIGAFAHDRGCMIRSLIVDKEVGNWREMIPVALNTMGWENKATREDLLMKLIHELDMGWGGVVDQPSEEFKKGPPNKFFPPSVTTGEDGYSVDFWVLEPGGMLPENAYSLYHLEFNEEGTLMEAELTDGFVVELQ